MNLVKTIYSFEDICTKIGYEPKKLSYIIYKIPEERKYLKFEIPKKTGGFRNISRPVTSLLLAQKKFYDYVAQIHEAKKCSFGFEINKNTLKNAKQHLKSKLVLNVDLHNFFGSINFGRVYGLFRSPAFNFDKKAAAAFAKLVTIENQLPQGAPTSPILSNMIARSLDNDLIQLAKINGCRYSRYVDDITFSTTKKMFENGIVIDGKLDKVNLGLQLERIVKSNGFEINSKKSRLLFNSVRKDVTGIIINEFPNVPRKYINSIHGMIHSWKMFGYENAQDNYETNYLKLEPGKNKNAYLYKQVIQGKINYVAHVRGWDDRIVHKLCRNYVKVDPAAPEKIKILGGIEMEYQIFIGHASEQKKEIAIPLYDELKKLGIKAFIDLVEIKWGDSLTKIINSALSKSEFFLAIISKDSISKSWPDKEMNSAIAREIDNKQIVLPLFVGSKEEIEELKAHYALIADKLHKVWNNNAEEIAKEIELLIKS